MTRNFHQAMYVCVGLCIAVYIKSVGKVVYSLVGLCTAVYGYVGLCIVVDWCVGPCMCVEDHV